ncbi:hypothetical protein [Brevundimonas sp.]
MIRSVVATLAIVCAATSVSAEVVSKSDDAFVLNFEQRVEASPDVILSTIARPAAWWSSDHTYSGSAENITLDLRPGGCWCEGLPGGGVKHGEVLLVWPEQRQIRFEAPFGPLQAMGADAILTMSWADAEGGSSRLFKWTLVVRGAEVGAMADPVHGVMQGAFAGLVRRIEASEP